MFRHYQLVIFRDHHGAYRKLRFRGWLFALMLLALAALVAGDVYLVKYYYNYKRMEHELAELWQRGTHLSDPQIGNFLLCSTHFQRAMQVLSFRDSED